jgi:hypothetical protein
MHNYISACVLLFVYNYWRCRSNYQEGVLDRNILYFDENKYGTDNELMKWKPQEYHTIEIVLKSNRKIVGTETSLETEAKAIPITRKYMTVHFHSLVQSI